jgi:hypothetical protein
MSDTPRTDKAAFPPPEALVTADFARELERELARVTAEVAALKACDPLAEMWRELAEYQPIADLDGHGESWAKMCRERTEDAARAAMEDDAARSAAGYAAAAASGASGASMWARLSIALIRRAKEER